jgi:hypothetical protein
MYPYCRSNPGFEQFLDPDIQKVDIVMLCQITCLEAHPGVEKAYPAVTHEGLRLQSDRLPSHQGGSP